VTEKRERDRERERNRATHKPRDGVTLSNREMKMMYERQKLH
jgi:hypothetical protein